MKNNINCIVDWTNKTIRVTEAFYKKARIFGTDEFNQLAALRQQLPDYRVEKTTRKNGTSKLTYEQMETYLLRYVGQEAADELNKKRSERITLKDGTTKVKNTFFSNRTWFINTYPNAERQIKTDEQQEATDAIDETFSNAE